MISTTDLQRLLTLNGAEVLWQGLHLLGEMDNRLYCGGSDNTRANGGTVGGHFRHCLEFVNCLLAGIETGRVDYNRRARDNRVENDREYAIAEFAKVIHLLENFPALTPNQPLLVKPEDIVSETDFWCASSVERELEFLQSHTIHHYALIAFKLRAMNFAVPPEFGVAPSTLKFWKQNKNI